MDLRERIYGILKGCPLATLATVTEDGRPWARFVMIVVERDLSIKFATAMNSRKVNHINHNPEVHVTCGAALTDSLAPYLQVEGKARITRDEGIRQQMWTEVLKRYFYGPGDPNYCVGIVEPYRIEHYGTSIHPEVWEPAKK